MKSPAKLSTPEISDPTLSIDDIFAVAPAGWKFTRRFGPHGLCLESLPTFKKDRDIVMVIVDVSIREGQRWLHVSASRKNKMPTHSQMQRVKDAFVGPGRYAYTVMPPADLHVNLHRHCLHLYALLDGESGRALPEFSGELPGIGRTI